MKKKVFLLFCIMVSLFLTSCTLYQVQGIENFHPEHSQNGLTQSFIPDGFLTMFSYEEADYDYIYQKRKPSPNSTHKYTYETALLYMVYDEETYIKAKEYYFANMLEDEIHSETYKTFVFKKNMAPAEPNNSTRIYLAYSDEHCALLAVGTYETWGYHYITLGEYMETYFPFFNFEEVRIERGDAVTTSSTAVTIAPTSSVATES